MNKNFNEYCFKYTIDYHDSREPEECEWYSTPTTSFSVAKLRFRAFLSLLHDIHPNFTVRAVNDDGVDDVNVFSWSPFSE